MAEAEFEDRLYQAFLRGYRESATGTVGHGPHVGIAPFPHAFVIQAASLESKELRRSIDACQGALAQLDSLPPVEQNQLKAEARASLEELQSAADRLFARLQSLRPPPGSAASQSDLPPPATPIATSVRRKKPRSRR